MERGSPAALAAAATDHADRGELGSLSQKTTEAIEVTTMDDLGQLDGNRITVGQCRRECSRVRRVRS
jgi:hypothetical protein